MGKALEDLHRQSRRISRPPAALPSAGSRIINSGAAGAGPGVTREGRAQAGAPA